MSDVKPEMLWVDLETPGLNPAEPWSAILEASVVATDRYGNMLGSVSVIPSYPSNFLDYMIESMDAYCGDMHTKSGLLVDLRKKQADAVWDLEMGTNKALAIEDWMASIRMYPMLEAFRLLVGGMRRVCKVNPRDHQLPMAGATVHFDREWLRYFWPEIEAGFHYRNFDISTIRKSVELLRPDLAAREPEKRYGHRAFADIEDAIEYYKWAQAHFFQKGGVSAGQG